MGYETVAAENGKEVTTLLRVLSPDAILLDVKMPVIDGLSALKEIRGNQNTNSIPVIVVTAYSETDIARQCDDLGVASFLTKPMDLIDFNQALQKCITFSGTKKRRHLRTMVDMNVVLVHKGKPIEQHAVTLSEGRIYIRSEDPLPTGTHVEVTLPRKDQEGIALMGKVIYHRGVYGPVTQLIPGMAIEFYNVSKESSGFLRSIILNQLSKDIPEHIKLEIISKESKENGKPPELNRDLY
jgi:CheY-like chemotaxis protein